MCRIVLTSFHLAVNILTLLHPHFQVLLEGALRIIVGN